MRADKAQIRSFFEQAGPVMDVRLITDKFTRKSKGMGYVEMEKLEDVPKVLICLSAPSLYSITTSHNTLSY